MRIPERGEIWIGRLSSSIERDDEFENHRIPKNRRFLVLSEVNLNGESQRATIAPLSSSSYDCWWEVAIDPDEVQSLGPLRPGLTTRSFVKCGNLYHAHLDEGDEYDDRNEISRPLCALTEGALARIMETLGEVLNNWDNGLPEYFHEGCLLRRATYRGEELDVALATLPGDSAKQVRVIVLPVTVRIASAETDRYDPGIMSISDPTTSGALPVRVEYEQLVTRSVARSDIASGKRLYGAQITKEQLDSIGEVLAWRLGFK
jgi:hypothetical protein